MSLPFAPACLPIIWGGLPHRSAQAAVAAVLSATPELPSWPTLAQRNFRENLLAQAAVGFPGLQLDVERERVAVERIFAERSLDRIGLAYLRGEPMLGALPADYAAGLGELLRRMGGGHRARGLKGSLLGPISLALMLTDEHERPLAYEPALREALMQHIALRGTWLCEQLSTYTDSVVICLDEPFLDALDSPLCPISWAEGSLLLERALADIPACRGISSSSQIHWENLVTLPLDLIVFDAYAQAPQLIQAAKAVAAFLDRGGILGWGIVPHDPTILAQERPETLIQRFESMVDFLAVASGMQRERILSAALITSSGSLAQLDIEAAEQILRTCTAVSQQLRTKYYL